ncbi:tautomerase family protein [Helicobacter sp. 23-1045]
MPLVTIKLAKPELPKAQKEQLIADITELLSTKYGKAKERIVVCLESIEPSDIGFGGVSVEQIKKQIKKAKK